MNADKKFTLDVTTHGSPINLWIFYRRSLPCRRMVPEATFLSPARQAPTEEIAGYVSSVDTAGEYLAEDTRYSRSSAFICVHPRLKPFFGPSLPGGTCDG